MVDDQDPEKPYFFCGTTTGDILCINMKSNILQFEVPTKDKFSLSVTALSFVKLTDKGFNILVGTGSGIVGNYDICVSIQNGNQVKATFKHRKDAQPWVHDQECSAITSIAKRGAGHQFFVGTAHSQIYKFQFADFKADLVKTCHSSNVKDIIFPFGAHQLVITCQAGEIRTWNLLTGQELRRYSLANYTCDCLAITRDGKDIISGWSDGKIRIFGLNKDGALELRHQVMDAHNKGVTAVAITSCGGCIVSGGGEGTVRVWDFVKGMDFKGKREMRVDLKYSMKEHKNFVSEIVMHSSDKECASAGGDGTTIVWDLLRGVRKTIVFSNTLFKSVCYGYDEVQIVTCGTDRKLAYWETFDGSAIRELEGSKSGSVNFMDISSDYRILVTGGEDKLLKVWLYKEGEVLFVGKGHSTPISRIRIAPNNKSIVSVSEDGAILQWKFPNC